METQTPEWMHHLSQQWVNYPYPDTYDQRDAASAADKQAEQAAKDHAVRPGLADGWRKVFGEDPPDPSTAVETFTNADGVTWRLYADGRASCEGNGPVHLYGKEGPALASVLVTVKPEG